MATIFVVIVRARRFAVAATASHTCLSVNVVVAELVEFRIHTAVRVNTIVRVKNGCLQCFRMSVCLRGGRVNVPVSSEGSGAVAERRGCRARESRSGGEGRWY